MKNEYDVSRAFYRIEYELIDSMIRNLKRHRAEEEKEGLNWEQWQAIQLQELERYRKENPNKFGAEFADINERIEEILRTSYRDGKTKKEASILKRLLGFGKYRKPKDKGFFSLNIGKLEHLIDATRADFEKGEVSLLRRANDLYRRIIFDAQIHASTGGTYEQAVDMATKDFLRAGIQSITYKNGARHTIQDYASMAIRTGQQRAHLMGEGDLHDQYGIHTVRVNQRTNACPLCVRWLGKVLVDDVYSGGTEEEAKELNVPTLSQAMAMGFLHPNCKDTYSVYIEGVSRPAEPWTEQELQEVADNYNIEQAYKHADGMARSYERMAKWSLDEDNRKKYETRRDYWKNKSEELEEQLSAVEDVDINEIEADASPFEIIMYASESNKLDEIDDYLSDMDDEERAVWEDAIRTIPIRFDVEKGRENQDPLLNEVHLNENSDARVFFHELGHGIDYKNRHALEVETENGGKAYVSPSGIIDTTSDPDAIYKEIIDFFDYETNNRGRIIGASNSRTAELSVKYQNNKGKFKVWGMSLYDDGFEPWEVSVLVDCIEAITEGDVGEYNLFGGHTRQYWQSQSYWNTPDSEIFNQGVGTRGTRELWAQYCSMRAMKKEKMIEKLREVSPTLVEELEYSYGEIFYE